MERSKFITNINCQCLKGRKKGPHLIHWLMLSWLTACWWKLWPIETLGSTKTPIGQMSCTFKEFFYLLIGTDGGNKEATWWNWTLPQHLLVGKVIHSWSITYSITFTMSNVFKVHKKNLINKRKIMANGQTVFIDYIFIIYHTYLFPSNCHLNNFRKSAATEGKCSSS